MERSALIAKPWLRVILFLVSLLAVYMLLGLLAGMLLGVVKEEQTNATGLRAVWQNLQKSGYILPLAISVAASFVTVFIFRKRIDRRSVYSLGFDFSRHRSSAATGFFLALLLLGTGTFVLIASGNLQWEDIQFNASRLFIDGVLLLGVAFGEELVFRGYILNNLLQFTNKWVALVVSAVLFALFHVNNPGMNALPVINIFLAGLMLGVNYIYTKNLWFGILLHFGWNFYMGCILGYKVSGLPFQSLFQQTLSGSALLTGGRFGFEGSAIGTLLYILAVVAIIFVYEKNFQNQRCRLPGDNSTIVQAGVRAQ